MICFSDGRNRTGDQRESLFDAVIHFEDGRREADGRVIYGSFK